MTSNVGSNLIKNSGGLLLKARTEQVNFDQVEMMLKDEIQKAFRPEFLGRLDKTIFFKSLRREDLRHIVDIELDSVRKRLEKKGIEIVLTDEARDFIIEKGGNPDDGARPLRRAIEAQVEDHLAEEILKGAFPVRTRVTVTVSDGHLYFRNEPVEPDGAPDESEPVAKST
jgi:ATP-dependent Clp protease ATP-binding subunit ClpC